MKNIIIIILVVILAGGLIWYLSIRTSEEPILPEEKINSFEECIKAGYPPLESYPRQCITPDGKTFIEKIEIEDEMTEEQACIDSDGTVELGMCCLAVGDFPNLCLIGACGCSPENSHQVKICDCGEERCFDGNICVAIQ